MHCVSSSPSLHQQCLHMQSRHYETETVSCHQLASVHCQQVQVRHTAVPTFMQCLTVWGVEPAMTHHTSQHESIGECEKQQHQAGEVSAPTRACCWQSGPNDDKCCPKTVCVHTGKSSCSPAALRQYVFTLKQQAAHLLCQLWVKQLLHRCMVLPA